MLSDHSFRMNATPGSSRTLESASSENVSSAHSLPAEPIRAASCGSCRMANCVRNLFGMNRIDEQPGDAVLHCIRYAARSPRDDRLAAGRRFHQRDPEPFSQNAALRAIFTAAHDEGIARVVQRREFGIGDPSRQTRRCSELRIRVPADGDNRDRRPHQQSRRRHQAGRAQPAVAPEARHRGPCNSFPRTMLQTDSRREPDFLKQLLPPAKAGSGSIAENADAGLKAGST